VPPSGATGGSCWVCSAGVSVSPAGRSPVGFSTRSVSRGADGFAMRSVPGAAFASPVVPALAPEIDFPDRSGLCSDCPDRSASCCPEPGLAIRSVLGGELAAADDPASPAGPDCSPVADSPVPEPVADLPERSASDEELTFPERSASGAEPCFAVRSVLDEEPVAAVRSSCSPDCEPGCPPRSGRELASPVSAAPDEPVREPSNPDCSVPGGTSDFPERSASWAEPGFAMRSVPGAAFDAAAVPALVPEVDFPDCSGLCTGFPGSDFPDSGSVRESGFPVRSVSGGEISVADCSSDRELASPASAAPDSAAPDSAAPDFAVLVSGVLAASAPELADPAGSVPDELRWVFPDCSGAA